MQVITEFHGAPNHDGTSISISPPFSIPVCTKLFISINKNQGYVYLHQFSLHSKKNCGYQETREIIMLKLEGIWWHSITLYIRL